MDLGQIVALVTSGSVLTGFGAALNGWIRSKSEAKIAESKLAADISLAGDNQEFNQQLTIITDLRRRIEFLEQANADCVKDRGDLRYQVGHLEGRIDEQARSMHSLRTTSAEQARDAVQKAGEVAAEGVKVAAQLVNAAMSDSAIRLQESQAASKPNDKLTDPNIESVHN